jgi:hypothetical protein
MTLVPCAIGLTGRRLKKYDHNGQVRAELCQIAMTRKNPLGGLTAKGFSIEAQRGGAGMSLSLNRLSYSHKASYPMTKGPLPVAAFVMSFCGGTGQVVSLSFTAPAAEAETQEGSA